MKRMVAWLLILAVAIAGLYLAERRKHRDAVSPDAILDAAADFERDLTRVPMSLTRLTDAEEIRIGDQLARYYVAELPAPDPSLEDTEGSVARVGAQVALTPAAGCRIAST